MADARFVRLEGLESPCLLVTSDGSVPEELVVDLPEPPGNVKVAGDLKVEAGGSAAAESSVSMRRSVVFRLQPTTAHDPYPAYVEVFDE